MHCKFVRGVVCLKNVRVHSTISGEMNAKKSSPPPRPFNEIPGPLSLPIIGTLYKYLPVIGKYSFDQLCNTGLKKYQQYGPLVREEIVPGVQTLWVYRPEDIAKVFQIDIAHYPERRSHLALHKYRTDRSHIYNNGGLVPTNGTEWWRLRKEFQKGLSKPKNVMTYLDGVDDVIRQFTDICKKQNEHRDFLPLLSRLFLELTSLVAFDIKLNSFSPKEMYKNSKSSRLIDAAFTTNSGILKLDNGPRLWRYYDTPLYKKLYKAQRDMEEIAIEMVSKKVQDMSSSASENESLLESYLSNPNLDKKDVIGMACDMLLAGIDTTSYSSAFALYHLATNQSTQEKLHKEAISLLNEENTHLTADVLKKAHYTKAVIKETFRLNPISVGVGRILQADTVLNGYHIPKGVILVTQNQVICRLPEYFNDPDSFIAERWLRQDGNNAKSNAYLILPFGHGPRSCIARRLAEQNLQTLLLRMCREFKITWQGERLGVKSVLINKPDAPIHLKFESRS